MTTPGTEAAHEQYRKGVRILIALLILYLPVVAVIGFGLDKLLDSELPFAIAAPAYLAVVVIFSVRTLRAYYRWTGKYPYYWLPK